MRYFKSFISTIILLINLVKIINYMLNINSDYTEFFSDL